MSISIVDITIDGVRIFNKSHFFIDFRNERRVYPAEADEKIVTQMAGTNYRNHVIALAGINASGKTSSLELIDFVLQVFVLGEGLNTDSRVTALLEDKSTFTIHLFDAPSVYELKAEIQKEWEGNHARLVFAEETVLSKKITANESKESFLLFKSSKPRQQRSQLGKAAMTFLKDEDSMFPGMFIKKELPNNYVQQTFSGTDWNFLYCFSNDDEVLLQYLDDRIESFEFLNPEMLDQKGAEPMFRLKFYDDLPKEVSYVRLNEYLSSGTIRGLTIFNLVMAVLENGGYLLVDELDIHFNKIIVEHIISFFQSEINRNGATLIFSTHYSELLDKIERKEEIKVLRKKNRELTMNSLSELLRGSKKDRTDVKNSDMILSGLFDTAPSYERYWNLHQKIGEAAVGKLKK